MRSVLFAALVVALTGCAPVDDEPVVSAAGGGVDVSAEEALAAAQRAHAARAADADANAAAASVEVK